MGGVQESWCYEWLDTAVAVQELEVDDAGWEGCDSVLPDFETELDREAREEMKGGNGWHFRCCRGNVK
jgi:hypothetical protein